MTPGGIPGTARDAGDGGGGVPGAVRGGPGLPPRRVPATVDGRHRPGGVGAGVGAHRIGQDPDRRVCRRPGGGSGGKAFYTTPIKALSNQKFAELSLRYGEDRVGLLTGDVSHQARAPMVVMTTEVLRNMIFARSALLDDLAVVILDEVHYLQDPYRGSVWEEVLVLAPPGVRFVSLSATVSNATDFGAWLTSVRGTTRVIVETHRPVTLHHHFAIAERGSDAADRAAAAPRREGQPRRCRPRRAPPPESAPPPPGTPADPGRRVPGRRGHAARHHLHLLEGRLRRRHPPVPAGRDPADHARGAGSGSAELTEEAVDRLDDDDLATLGYGPWSAALEAGIAPHHAGLVPAFRQAVEQCFSEGLLKVVFATETLALGINMPARTVVVERFAKFRGSDTSALTSGEYQQLTGRAGRRGIDTVGHAFVLWSPATPFSLVARTAVAPPPDLVSSFHPTYNLAVNLVRRWTRDEAHRLLAASYGQWQAPPGSVSLSAQLDRRLAILEERGFIEGWRMTEAGHALGLDLPRVGPAGDRGAASTGCSTGSTRRCWPGWSPPSPSRPAGPGTTTPPRASRWWSTGWPGWAAWPPGCGPTSGGSGSGGPGAPTPGWPGR